MIKLRKYKTEKERVEAYKKRKIEWARKNPDKVKAAAKKYKESKKGKDQIGEYRKKYRSSKENYQKHLEWNREYLKKYNKSPKTKKLKSDWHQKNKEEMNKRSLEFKRKYAEKIKENRIKYKPRKNERRAIRMKTDREYRLIERMRGRIHKSIKRKFKKSD